MICPICLGVGCSDCKKTEGNFVHKICPYCAKIEALKRLGLFYSAFHWMTEKSIFPVEGSWLNQSYSFISACDFMNCYVSRHMKKKQDMNEKFKRLKGHKK